MPTQSLRARRNFCPDYSHVVAALIRGFHEAKVSGVSDVVGYRDVAAGIALCRRSCGCRIHLMKIFQR
jgi:hypothetical protein